MVLINDNVVDEESQILYKDVSDTHRIEVTTKVFINNVNFSPCKILNGGKIIYKSRKNLNLYRTMRKKNGTSS